MLLRRGRGSVLDSVVRGILQGFPCSFFGRRVGVCFVDLRLRFAFLLGIGALLLLF